MTVQEDANKILINILKELKKINNEGIIVYHDYSSHSKQKHKEGKWKIRRLGKKH